MFKIFEGGRIKHGDAKHTTQNKSWLSHIKFLWEKEHAGRVTFRVKHPRHLPHALSQFNFLTNYRNPFVARSQRNEHVYVFQSVNDCSERIDRFPGESAETHHTITVSL